MDSLATTGTEALRDYAGEAADAFGALEAAAWGSAAAARLAGVAEVCRKALGVPVLVAPGVTPQPPSPRVEAFAEQFCIDVAAMPEALREAVVAEVGAGVGSLAQGLYVLDVFSRARAALDALFGPSHWPAPVPAAGVDDAGLWAAADGFLRAVARRATADPEAGGLGQLTAELVRLRGASQHNCRICRSVRNRSAIKAGGSDELFAAVDDPATPGLSAAQRTAVAFTDAFIWTPRSLAGPAAELRRHFSSPQTVALVLWVSRNAANKAAVALAADTPHVTEGVEIYDLDPTGDPVYGVPVG